MILEEFIIQLPKVAEGSYGEVFLATKNNSPTIYAVKKVEKRKILGEKLKEYFYNEVGILKRMKHENIIKLEEIKQTHNSIYLITDYCNGGTLTENLSKFKKINKSPFTEKLVIHFMKQISSALNYLHNLKIIHRDLKTDNILLHFDDEEDKKRLNFLKAKIKIIDFGFAKFLYNDNDIFTSIVGSPLNMDPIILKAYANPNFRKNLQYNEKADIYSIGVIMFYLLVGKPPFNAGDHLDLYTKVNDGAFSIPKVLKLSNECLKLLQGMLMLDPSQRLSSKDISKSEFLNKNPESFKLIDFSKDIGGMQRDSSMIILNIKEMMNFGIEEKEEESEMDRINHYLDEVNATLGKKDLICITNNKNDEISWKNKPEENKEKEKEDFIEEKNEQNDDINQKNEIFKEQENKRDLIYDIVEDKNQRKTIEMKKINTNMNVPKNEIKQEKENDLFNFDMNKLEKAFEMINKTMESFKMEPIPLNLDNPTKYENFLI